MSEYDGSHKYQVVFVDEYNNWYLCGFYDNLSDALPQVNAYLEGYEGYADGDEPTAGHIWLGEGSPFGDLEEYAGTIGPVFDRTFSTPSGEIQIRGVCA